MVGVAFLKSHAFVTLFVLLTIADKEELCGGIEVVLPNAYAALSGDLEAHVTGGWAGLTGRLQLLEYLTSTGFPTSTMGVDETTTLSSSTEDPSLEGWHPLGTLPLTWTDNPSLKVRFPCGVIPRGGRFGVRLMADLVNQTYSDQITTLDVRWPSASLSLSPKEIQTYPENEVVASLSFQRTFCQPALGTVQPETWLNLLYCGHSSLGCTASNSSHTQLVYSEQIRGYPGLREISLKCQLFGMAGHYALALRPSIQNSGEPIAVTVTPNSLKAIWSERFVFNVHARSIFPCDGHSGVTVLFQYPDCILAQGDRVRLFSRLRADVSSLAPPSSLHYVSEQRVSRGRHSLRFDCSLFSERFVEYCFVYVSQSITGAVSDVRMDCVPTLPVLESDSGNWGEWSPWTQCTSTCSGGTRNRYRFCDSPPPRYGAKFCQGHALETESCGRSAGSWECRYYPDAGSGEVPADRPEVKAEVGPGCRCGCIVHLGTGKSRRLIAASSHSCPGRTFWLIQTERDRAVRLNMEQLRLPCSAQSLKIRDGDSSTATMLARLSGTPLEVAPLQSSGSALLIEFNAGDMVTSGEECSGGFLAHASQIERPATNENGDPLVLETMRGRWGVNGETWLSSPGGLVNTGLALILVTAILASACLGAQYVYRYRKYQLTASHDDADSFATDNNSCGSLVVGRSRATSSTTLLSEVISLQRFRGGTKHSRLAEEEAELNDLSRDDERKELIDKEKRSDNGENVEEMGKPLGEAERKTSVEQEKRPSSLEVPRTPQLPRRQIRMLKARKFVSPVSPVAEGPEDDTVEIKTDGKVTPVVKKRKASARPSASSSQSSTLTNGSSPASIVLNCKETKEKRNRERMLAGSSEFSLNGPDLEMDYYDYNVQNAAPGSYLAMDPAYCLWIPPFAPGVWSETQFNGKESEDEENDRDTFKSEESLFDNCNSTGESKIVSSTSNRALSSILYTTDDDSSAALVEKTKACSPVKVHQYSSKHRDKEKSPSSSEYYDLMEKEDEELKYADDDDDDENEKVSDSGENKITVEVHSNGVPNNKLNQVQ